MLFRVPTDDCLQAREAASARLDGELSELEAARLTAHLRDCTACSVYALELSAIAESLRSAELEQPRFDVTLPRRRALPGIRVAAVAAAVLAVAAGSAYAVGQGLGSGGHAKVNIEALTPSLVGLQADSRNQHLFAMLRNVTPQRGEVQPGRLIFA